VARPRLLATLDAAVSGQLVLVCAPAGYGKTLLLAEWAADNPATTAWVALDEDDNDDRRFWSAVLTGLAACAAFADVPDLGRLAVPARPSYDHDFVATVLAAIETAPSAVRLMLDDVHELTAPEPLHGLRALVRNQPPGLQVVLAGRSDPPLPLGRMRLGGRLCEIRAADLRFSLAEADAMFAAARIPVRADQLRRLVAQTEGWAAGLRLAALSMRGIADPDGFLADFVANSRAVSDYLVSEILERLPAADRELLGAVSVCDRLSAPLAAALSGRPDAGEVLDALEHETSLVISVGDGRVWYRVHPLLRSHLLADLRRRRPDLVTELHGRAAGWFADRDQPVPALAHARQSDDAALLVALLRRHAMALVGNGQLRVVREALAWLADRGQDDDVWLALLGVLVDLETGSGPAARRRLERTDDRWPADPAPEVVALRNRIRARLAVSDGDVDAVLAATEGHRAADVADPEIAIMSRLERAIALAMADRRAEAQRTAQPALDQARERGLGLLVAQGLTVLAYIAGGSGDYRRMTELAERADRDVPPSTEWAATGGAAVASMLRAFGALLRADAGQCLDLVATAMAFTAADSPPDAMVATCLALRGAARVDVGRHPEGLEDLRSARAAAVTVNAGPELIAMVALLEHRAASLLGRHDLARTVAGWAVRALGDTGEVALLQAWRLSDLGRHRAADAALAPLLDGSTPAVTPWASIEAGVVDCHLALAAHQPTRARTSLDRALELTEAMDARRPLACAPADVVDLLVRHLGSFGAVDPTARRVLAARHALGIDRTAVALTDRERSVLNLLPSQRSFDEIASDLMVSHSTVKTHVRAIYTKLEAGSRREAVDIARRHSLLLPEA
jgi:LuxR family maltose regulon positive regulatory protein